MNTPLVSIIIPTYNRASRIITTLDSVLNQTYQNIEVIVVDDGSTDNTDNVLNEYKQKAIQKHITLKYIKQNNAGAPVARNNGFRNSKGEYVVFFDSDDIMLPNRIEEQISIILLEKSDCCACGFYKNSKQKQYIPSITKNVLYSFLKAKLSGSTQSWMFKKSLVLQINGYDESLQCRQDFDIVFRILTQNPKISIVLKPLSIFVAHNDDLRIMNLFKNNILGYNAKIKYHSKIIDYFILNRKNRLLFTEIHNCCSDTILSLSSVKYSLVIKEYFNFLKRNRKYSLGYQIYMSVSFFSAMHYYYFRLRKK
jgi:glycosyltransferase involved in cell wall biosynthesis